MEEIKEDIDVLTLLRQAHEPKELVILTKLDLMIMQQTLLWIFDAYEGGEAAYQYTIENLAFQFERYIAQAHRERLEVTAHDIEVFSAIIANIRKHVFSAFDESHERYSPTFCDLIASFEERYTATKIDI